MLSILYTDFSYIENISFFSCENLGFPLVCLGRGHSFLYLYLKTHNLLTYESNILFTNSDGKNINIYFEGACTKDHPLSGTESIIFLGMKCYETYTSRNDA